MLILTRKLGESLKIGNNITVTVTAIDEHGPQVKLGIDAPPEILVMREELLDPDKRKDRDKP